MTCPQCGRHLSPDGACAACGVVAPAAAETSAGDPPLRPASTTSDCAQVFHPGDEVARRYRIIRAIGKGGMGLVYQAWDQELGVAVALKLIRPDAAADPAAARETERRFKRELLLARQVSHKHVVRIHDMGDIDGAKYITMTYVEGEDLATTLKREKRLPPSQVVRLARQLAQGLLAAHESGVVHRDLKPANIMVDRDGQAFDMDFGIALPTGEPREPAVNRADSVGGPRPVAADLAAGTLMPTLGGTVLGGENGAIVGTIEYMAPEQARGDAIDHRADIYAFGLILYDMLLGLREPAPGTHPYRN
jgi:serine/threonine protein kinase